MRTVYLALTNLVFAISMFVGVFAVWDFTLGKWMNGCASTVIAGLFMFYYVCALQICVKWVATNKDGK